MLAEILYRLTTMDRVIAYEKERTRSVIGFLVTGIVVISVLAGMLRVMQNREWDRNTGHSTGSCRQHAALHCNTSSGIHR